MAARTFNIPGLCLVVVALLVTAGSSSVFAGDAENGKIVTVDIKQIMAKHPAFNEAQQQLQSEARQIQEQMKGKSQQEQQGARQQLQQRSRQLQAEALDKLKADIQKIAEEKGYTYVMDSNALLAGGEDVTETILKAINGKAAE